LKDKFKFNEFQSSLDYNYSTTSQKYTKQYTNILNVEGTRISMLCIFQKSNDGHTDQLPLVVSEYKTK